MLNLSFICNDSDLIKKFSAVEEFNIVNNNVTLGAELSAQESGDILIVSDLSVGLNRFISCVTDIKSKYDKIFYMVSNKNMNFNTKNILTQHGIIMVPPKNTVQKIFEFVCSEVLDNFHNENNIVVFFGADTKVGTTMLSQSVAEIIAANSDKKVFLGFMDGFPGTDYFKGGFPGCIDEIKLRLLNRVLDISEILSECKDVGDNLFVLEGIRNFLYRCEYEIEDAEYLFNILSENFDIVILEAGCEIDLALSFWSLNATNNRYLVVTPQQKTFTKFRAIYAILEKLNVSSFSLVMNKYLPEFGKSYEIADRYGFPLSGELPFLDNGWQAEIENSTLYSFGDKKYCAKMDTFAAIVAHSVGIEIKTGKKKKSKLFG